MTTVEKKRTRPGRKESELRVIDAPVGSEEIKKSVHEHYLKNKKVYNTLAKL